MLRSALTRFLLWYIRRFPFHYRKGGLYRVFVEPRLVRGIGPVVGESVFGMKFNLDTVDVLQRYVYSFGIWEPALTSFVEHRLQPGDTFIDVGANIGYYSLLASTKVGPAGHVLSIEASPKVFALLEGNLRLNHAGNVRLVNMAASDRSGVVQVFAGPVGNLGQTTLLASRGLAPECRVRCDKLSAIATPSEMCSARIIKIDVEGHEMAVLDGLIEALPHTRHDLEVLMEVNENELQAQGTSAEALLARWERAGFHSYAFDNRYWPGFYAVRDHRLTALRVRAPLLGQVDLVFSRIDAEALDCRRPDPSALTATKEWPPPGRSAAPPPGAAGRLPRV